MQDRSLCSWCSRLCFAKQGCVVGKAIPDFNSQACRMHVDPVQSAPKYIESRSMRSRMSQQRMANSQLQPGALEKVFVRLDASMLSQEPILSH